MQNVETVTVEIEEFLELYGKVEAMVRNCLLR